MKDVVGSRSGRVGELLGRLDESGWPFPSALRPNDVRVEDYVDDQTYVVRAEMPGLDPDKDLDVHIEDDALVLRGERREEKHDKNHRELRYGSFTRSVRLPRGTRVDDVKASYTDGVLEVRVPLEAGAAEVRRISIPVQRA
jgi:HSP20 family molecular chaperone IbpA